LPVAATALIFVFGIVFRKQRQNNPSLPHDSTLCGLEKRKPGSPTMLMSKNSF
jgi:hypothetical protein